MKWFLLLLLAPIPFFAGYLGAKYFYLKFIEKKVLSKSSENNLLDTPLTATTSPTPTSTPSPSPTLTPKPTNEPIPSPTTIPQPKLSSEEIHKLMERFAGQYGVDVNILRHIATCESGFNPSAINGVYAGLYQFNTITWVNNRRLMGEDTNPDLRFNAEESIQTAAYLASKGKGYLWPNCYP